MSELEMGLKVEKEHAETIRKIKANPEITEEEAEKMIAQDHLNEASNYYTLLAEMESKFPKKGQEQKQEVKAAWTTVTAADTLAEIVEQFRDPQELIRMIRQYPQQKGTVVAVDWKAVAAAIGLLASMMSISEAAVQKMAKEDPQSLMEYVVANMGEAEKEVSEMYQKSKPETEKSTEKTMHEQLAEQGVFEEMHPAVPDK
jgi:hypothetical protein